MEDLPASLRHHRMHADARDHVVRGRVRYAPAKSLWFTGMALAVVIGGALTFSWLALAVFLASTGTVLLLGHSLGSHRKLIHDSFTCPLWLERLLVYLGVQVGLAGPIGLLKQHELRDYAQRLPDCHSYLRHGSSFWKDAWWQLHCELVLDNPPALAIEPRIANDRFLAWLERTWMLQQVPPALLLYLAGGWAFVVWGTCARVTAGVLGHWLIGWFAHNRGPMHHVVDGAAVQGHNIRWTSLLTMGECWHNNHHAYPGSARLGIGPGEWDPGWWVLVALQKLGLVGHLRLPRDLPHRAELRAVDAIAMDAGSPQRALGWRLLWRISAMRETLQLRGPAATLPPAWFDRLAGSAGSFVHDPALPRLTARVGEHSLLGWGAVWLSLARRSRWHRAALVALLPAACAAEGLRDFCCEPA